MFDAHIHSSMSFDSSVPREDVVAEAVKRGFYGLCFTDHYDVVDSYGKFVPDYDWEGTRMAQQRALACAGGRIIVNNGIELGNAPYGFAAAESVLNAEPEVDFVLGSIHNASEKLDYKDYYLVDYTDTDICYKYLDDYFIQLEKLVEWGNFDSLAHVPYPLRYMMQRDGMDVDMARYQSSIDSMLRTLIRRGQAIEINAGKKPYIMPEYAYLLDRYRALGGRLITVGTDAHSIPQFGMGLKEAYMLALEKGFESVAVFKRRKCELVSIGKLLALE